MERIQSALAKARSARERKLQVPGLSSTVRAGGSGPWHDLAELSLNASVLERNRVVAINPTVSAGSFDVMRTNLLRTLRTNLAFSLARLADIKVLVVELDFRHPSIVTMLGQAPGQNFAGMLASSTQDLGQIRRWGPNLAFALTSKSLDSPAELLSASRTADTIDEIEALLRPDIILFDMSPMLVNDDAIAFLDQVDCALMVAAAEETTVSDVERCGKDLAKHTQVLGVVLNKCRYVGRGESLAYPE
jgi:protein-tyrosine kinase